MRSFLGKSNDSDLKDIWLVVLGLTVLSDSISVYIGPSPREREKELVGCFGLNGPSKEGRKKREMIHERKKSPNNHPPHLLQAQ